MQLPALPAAHDLTPTMIRLREKAEELEASFISEMLSYSGLRPDGSGFGGGEGEAQFASFLRNEQARLIAARGDFGIAESVFRALAKSEMSA